MKETRFITIKGNLHNFKTYRCLQSVTEYVLVFLKHAHFTILYNIARSLLKIKKCMAIDPGYCEISSK